MQPLATWTPFLVSHCLLQRGAGFANINDFCLERSLIRGTRSAVPEYGIDGQHTLTRPDCVAYVIGRNNNETAHAPKCQCVRLSLKMNPTQIQHNRRRQHFPRLNINFPVTRVHIQPIFADTAVVQCRPHTKHYRLARVSVSTLLVVVLKSILFLCN